VAHFVEGVPLSVDVTLTDRPRQGRAEQKASLPEARSVDELGPARAAIVAVLIGAFMWAVAIFAIWYFI
jgi:hypothetical protein